jgi:hypothetical protein
VGGEQAFLYTYSFSDMNILFCFVVSFLFCKFAVNTWGAQDLVQSSSLGMASKGAE